SVVGRRQDVRWASKSVRWRGIRVPFLFGWWLSLGVVIRIHLRRIVFVRSSIDDRLEIEVAMSRRTGSHPLQGVRPPRIPPDTSAPENAPDKVDGEHDLRGDEQNRTPRHKDIHVS